MARKTRTGGKAKPDSKNASLMPTQTNTAVEEQPTDSSPSRDEESLLKSVAFINQTYTKAAHKASQAIAKHVIKYFFNNDINLARSRNPKKGTSYRALCEHPDLMISPATLSNMVAVEVQEGFLSQQGVEADKLSYSHQVKLIRLPDGRDKLRLAKKIIDQGLSVRDLDVLVQETKKKIGHPRRLIPDLRGKYRDNPFLLLGNQERMDFVLDLDKLRKLPPQARQRFKEEVQATRKTLERSISEVDSIIKNIDELGMEDSEEGGKD
jgi:hypothetical protein